MHVKLRVNDSFEYPFLGRVNCHSREESVTIRVEGGGELPVAVKAYYTEDGRFLRAEFLKPQSTAREFPAAEIQQDMAKENMIVTGIPDAQPVLSLPEILTKVYEGTTTGQNGFGGATKMNVTRVKFKWGNRPERTVYIANLWEIDDEFFRGIGKGRYVFDEEGNSMFFDNVL